MIIRPDFNKIAPFYDFLVSFFSLNQVNKSRITFFKDLPQLNKALIIGGGTGDDLIALLKEGKIREMVYLDISDQMISITESKLKKLNRSHFNTSIDIRKEAFEDHEGNNYDLIVCNYFLDLFTPSEVDFYIKKIKSILKNEGIFICADFQLYNFSGVRKIVFNILEFLLLKFFSYTSQLSIKRISDYQSIIGSNNFKRYKCKSFFLGFIESVVWKNFKD